MLARLEKSWSILEELWLFIFVPKVSFNDVLKLELLRRASVSDTLSSFPSSDLSELSSTCANSWLVAVGGWLSLSSRLKSSFIFSVMR